MLRLIFLFLLLYVSFRFFWRLLGGAKISNNHSPFSGSNLGRNRGKQQIHDIEEADFVEIQDDSKTDSSK